MPTLPPNMAKQITRSYKGQSFTYNHCPFCGDSNVDISRRYRENELQGVYVDCYNCNARGPYVDRSYREDGSKDEIEACLMDDAISKWNSV